MKKVYYIKCSKCKIFKNPKISYIFNETLVLSIIFDECGGSNYTIFKKEKAFKY